VGNPKLIPYETIVRATSGEPEAVEEVLRHYSKRIRLAALENGHVNTDTEDSIRQRAIWFKLPPIFPYSAVSFPTADSNSSLTGETVITGRILDLIRACRIYSDWLILQRVTRSENSAYSSAVKRVLITRRRWGV